MKSIILVAGMGTRLKPLTNEVPKCLTEVNGKPILINMLENLEKVGVEETILVIGHLGEKIMNQIGNSFGKMKISYVRNDIYDKTSTSYSLWLALKNLAIENYLLVLEGDVFFEQKLLKDFLNYGALNSTIVQKYNPDLDGSFVDIRQGKVIDWIHKSRREQGFKIEDKFKTVNIHRFNKDFLENFLKPNLQKSINQTNGTDPIEYVMQDIVKEKKAEIYSFEANDLKWFEIDDLNELKIAEDIFKGNPSLEEIESFHGGFWRYNFLDFHYLVNLHFPTKEIYEKISKKLPELIECYPSTQRIIAELFSKWKDKPYFNKENLIITNGSSEAIKIFNQIMNKVTVPIPTFNEYVELPEEKLNLFLLDKENKFKINIDELIQEIKNSNSDFVIINNPNNPTGNITPREDIIKLLETRVNVIIDEAFIDFSIEDSVEDLIEKYENLIIIKTVTKTTGLAGLRLGYVLTKNKEIKEKFKKLLPIWNVNSIAEYFIEIFPQYKKEYWESIEKTKQERQELFNKLQNISFLEPYETGSNFIFCKTKTSSRKIAEFLYKNHNIILRNRLNQKILKSDNYIRIAIRTKEDNKKLIFALNELQNKTLV
jgi:histidinol-phosphate/aromatic aminotransferase/cobyric acid decarboxylase-like protein/choline kinase